VNAFEKVIGQMEIMNLLLCASPFILPCLLGIRILGQSSDDFSRLASWLTLKPLIATPIWFFLVDATFSGDWSRPGPAYVLTALPGIGITLIIVLIFRSVVQSHPSGIRMLLALDTLRWGSSFLMGLLPGSIKLLLAFIALAMPTVFALFAQVISKEAPQQ
jgi:hypothetical protein